jgi:membrane protein DedA with SNARE-associated domain
MQTAQELLARWHLLGLFALILIEEAGVPLPVPGDLFIAAMGVQARASLQPAAAAFLETAAAVTAATLLGAGLLFTLSQRAGRPLLLKVSRRFGYTEERNARVEAWLERRGMAAVILGRLTPGLRIVMTVVAGALGLKRSTFTVGTALAGAIWSVLYFWLGFALGAGVEQLGPRLRAHLPSIAAGLAVLLAVGLLARRLWLRHGSLAGR